MGGTAPLESEQPSFKIQKRRARSSVSQREAKRRRLSLRAAAVFGSLSVALLLLRPEYFPHAAVAAIAFVILAFYFKP